LNAASLGLWDATGLYAGYTDLSNAYLGAGSFYCNIVAPRHVPYSYERMLIAALFYQGSLRHYSREISLATHDLTDKPWWRGWPGAGFHALREEFITFTNRYWFQELTPQLQGKRIFQLQQAALGLTGEYEFIKEEMERADEFMAQKAGLLVAVIAIFIGVGALMLTLMPLIPLDDGIGSLWLSVQAADVWLRAVVLFLLALAPAALVGLGAWFYLKAGRGRQVRRP
jgi:hypothetical protein